MKHDQHLFALGAIMATPAALSALGEDMTLAGLLLERHARGDAGDVCDEDREINDDAIRHGGRVMSIYKLPLTSRTVWIITESDRRSTTLLIPSDY